MPAATSAPNAITRIDHGDRQRQDAGLPEVVRVRGLDRLDRARVAELRDEEVRMGALYRVDAVEDGVDLVDGVVLVAADLERDECGAPVLGDLALTAGIERRADVLHDVEPREPGDDVVDGGGEGRIARFERVALDHHGLAGGPLEAFVQDLLDTAGLARPRHRSGRGSSCPPRRRARRRRSPARASRSSPSSSAPRSSDPCGPPGCATALARRSERLLPPGLLAWRLWCLVRNILGPPVAGRVHASTLGPGCGERIVGRQDSGSDQPTIPTHTLVGRGTSGRGVHWTS